MIGYVKGHLITRIKETDRFYLVIVTPQDIPTLGIQTIVPAPAINRLKRQGTLHSGTLELFLYNYQTPKEQYSVGITSANRFKFFIHSVRVGGIGPKLAAFIVEFFDDFADLLDILARQDAKALAQVPGLGPKKAQKILLGLLDSKYIEQLIQDQRPAVEDKESKPHATTELPRVFYQQLYSTLLNLGLNATEAKKRLQERQDILLNYLKETKAPDLGEMLKFLLKK